MQARSLALRPLARTPSGIQSSLARRPVKINALFGLGTKPETVSSAPFYNYEVQDIDGRNVKLNKYKGNVVLVCNLASACGFTPQYAELSELYDKYKSKGFTILGFPCNQFGAQESGTNSEIKKFATQNYGAKFPLMSKVEVNGAGAEPLFDYLKSEQGGLLGNNIKWNFTKFLVDKEGKVVGRYAPTTTPAAMASDIEKLL